MSQLTRLTQPFRIEDGRRFRLKDYAPDEAPKIDKRERERLREVGIALLQEHQEKLYAQDRHSLLLVFQAMDAAGKDGTIKHVMTGVNPQGCQVYSFKAPSAEELDHDYLWRAARCLPERGRIGIFNRSYYEEVLVVRVHPELLEAQRLPPKLVTKRLWQERYEDINAMERYLSRNGVVILKFFLHLSRDEQKRRFLSRLDEPRKYWKFSMRDARERSFWDDYMDAYEQMIRNTATPHAPWYVVPADHKWFTRIVVAAAVIRAMEALHLSFPKVGAARRKELKAARRALLGKS